MTRFLSYFEAFIMVSALSLDAFAASFAYGTNKIKIPLKSVVIINFVCSVILGVALSAGSYIADFIPRSVTSWICFSILIFIAITKLFEFSIKNWIRRQGSDSPKTEFTIMNFRFCLQLIADPTRADADKSKVLSSKEAIALALSLSLDGLAVGLGAGMVSCGIPFILLLSF